MDPPLSAKAVGAPDGAIELRLVGSAASLLAGDELEVQLIVGEASALRVGGVAATLVHPSPDRRPARYRVLATVGAGSSLAWRPEPVIAAAGAVLEMSSEVQMANEASLEWWDELVLGRTGEPPDEVELATALSVDVAGRPLLRDGLRSTPGWRTAAVLGGARYCGSLLVAGPSTPSQPPLPWMALAGPGALARVLDEDPVAGRVALGDAWAAVGSPGRRSR